MPLSAASRIGLLVALGSLLRVTAPGPVPTPPARLARAQPVVPLRGGTVSFLAFGDSGTGGEGQRSVAAAMARVVRERPVDFALLLGDTFYPDGLASARDPLFESLFRGVYTRASFPFPFFASLGNHEYHKSPRALLGLGARDDRWRMPARRYAFVQPLGSGDSALFLALDTTAIEYPARVTPDVDVRPPLEGVAEELRAAAGFRWRFAFGHHVIGSSGAHGDSAALMAGLAPVLAAGKVDLYFCGHDHILESILEVAGVPQVTSGGAGGWDRATPILRAREGSEFRMAGGGFVRADVTGARTVVTFHDVAGQVRHVRELAPRR